MSTLRSEIVKELLKSETIQKSSGKAGDEVDLVILHLVQLINSGNFKGIFELRVNGHHLSNPKLTDQKVTIEELRDNFIKK